MNTPSILKNTKIWVIFTSLSIIAIAILWWCIFDFHNQRKESALNSWMEIELQIARSLATTAKKWIELRIIEDAMPIYIVEPEILKILIEPVKLLKTGSAWICHRDHLIYHKNIVPKDNDIHIGIRELFEHYRAIGATHFETICNGVLNGTEGKDWMVWSSIKGREYSAWTPIILHNELWTIGLSTPENEILEYAGIQTQNEREIGSALIITGLLLLILGLVWKQRIRELRTIELMKSTTDELSAFNEQLTLQLREKRRAEEELEKAISRLEERNTQIEQFTYMVSHDLKSPLITISAFLGMLEQDVVSGNLTGFRQSLTRIQNATSRMQKLLDDIFEIANNTQIIHPPERIPLSDLAKEATEITFGQIITKRVTVNIPPNLPTVIGDRPLLLRVMQNLIDNAIKFMGDQPNPTINITAHQTDTEIICCVSDNGIGINPKYYHKLFKIFERLDTKTEGTGIGLAIVKRIILEHGGRVWVESEGIGKGSSFYFALPRKE